MFIKKAITEKQLSEIASKLIRKAKKNRMLVTRRSAMSDLLEPETVLSEGGGLIRFPIKNKHWKWFSDILAERFDIPKKALMSREVKEIMFLHEKAEMQQAITKIKKYLKTRNVDDAPLPIFMGHQKPSVIIEESNIIASIPNSDRKRVILKAFKALRSQGEIDGIKVLDPSFIYGKSKWNRRRRAFIDAKHRNDIKGFEKALMKRLMAEGAR